LASAETGDMNGSAARLITDHCTSHLGSSLTGAGFCVGVATNLNQWQKSRFSVQHWNYARFGGAYCLFGVWFGGCDCQFCEYSLGNQNIGRQLLVLSGV